MKVLPYPSIPSSKLSFRRNNGNYPPAQYQYQQPSTKTLVAEELRSAIKTAFWGIGIGTMAGLVSSLFIASNTPARLNVMGIGALIGGAASMGVRSMKRSVTNFDKL